MNFGIIQTNHLGVIDHKHCGPNDWWKMPAHSQEIRLLNNDRICQFRIQKTNLQYTLKKLKSCFGEDRGGFRSIGENNDDFREHLTERLIEHIF